MLPMEVVQTITNYAKLCYDKGLVSASGGNISIRIGEHVYITATNSLLRNLKTQDIVGLNMKGEPLDINAKQPSKEWGLHVAVYQQRPDVDSVVHLHPVYSIVSSIAFGDQFECSTVSSKLKLKVIGYVPFAEAGSQKLIDSVTRAIQQKGSGMQIIMMERHGVLAFGKGLEAAFSIAELLEDTSKINCLAGILKVADNLPNEVTIC